MKYKVIRIINDLTGEIVNLNGYDIWHTTENSCIAYIVMNGVRTSFMQSFSKYDGYTVITEKVEG